jgi:hypothetical protein
VALGLLTRRQHDGVNHRRQLQHRSRTKENGITLKTTASDTIGIHNSGLEVTVTRTVVLVALRSSSFIHFSPSNVSGFCHPIVLVVATCSMCLGTTLRFNDVPSLVEVGDMHTKFAGKLNLNLAQTCYAMRQTKYAMRNRNGRKARCLHSSTVSFETEYKNQVLRFNETPEDPRQGVLGERHDRT